MIFFLEVGGEVFMYGKNVEGLWFITCVPVVVHYRITFDAEKLYGSPHTGEWRTPTGSGETFHDCSSCARSFGECGSRECSIHCRGVREQYCPVGTVKVQGRKTWHGSWGNIDHVSREWRLTLPWIWEQSVHRDVSPTSSCFLFLICMKRDFRYDIFSQWEEKSSNVWKEDGKFIINHFRNHFWCQEVLWQPEHRGVAKTSMYLGDSKFPASQNVLMPRSMMAASMHQGDFPWHFRHHDGCESENDASITATLFGISCTRKNNALTHTCAGTLSQVEMSKVTSADTSPPPCTSATVVVSFAS